MEKFFLNLMFQFDQILIKWFENLLDSSQKISDIICFKDSSLIEVAIFRVFFFFFFVYFALKATKCAISWCVRDILA